MFVKGEKQKSYGKNYPVFDCRSDRSEGVVTEGGYLGEVAGLGIVRIVWPYGALIIVVGFVSCVGFRIFRYGLPVWDFTY